MSAEGRAGRGSVAGCRYWAKGSLQGLGCKASGGCRGWMGVARGCLMQMAQLQTPMEHHGDQAPEGPGEEGALSSRTVQLRGGR